MNTHGRAGFRLLCATLRTLPLLSLLVFPAVDGRAASWQWSQIGQRERVIIDAEGAVLPQGAVRAERTGLQSLFLSLPVAAENFVLRGQGPGADRLVREVKLSGRGLEVLLHSPAFGYLISQPATGQVVVDIFFDPLGARWMPDGSLAPASTAERYTPPVAAVPVAAPVAAPVSAPVPAVDPAVAVPVSTADSPDPEPVAPALPSSNAFAATEGEEGLPLLDASATLRPEMPETSPPSLKPQNPRSDHSVFSLGSVAEAADAAQPTSLGDRGFMLSPQQVQAKVNQGGVEDWPLEEALSTVQAERPTPASPTLETSSASGTVSPLTLPESSATPGAPSSQPLMQPASPPSTTPGKPNAPKGEQNGQQSTVALPLGNEAVNADEGTSLRQSMPASPVAPEAATANANATRTVVYMDEAGNIVPKPPEPDKMLAEAEKLMSSTQYTEALPILHEIKALDVITREMREKVLYLISDAMEALYAGKSLEGYEPIVSSTNEAMNANLRSPRVPDALFRLGMANVRVGNIGEAEGYFKALKRRYPYDMNVPPAFCNLAKLMTDKGFHAQAAEYYRNVLQEYPETNVLRDAAVGLVHNLVRLKDYKEAALIADFVDKRWPRYYVSEPSFLGLMAELSYNQGQKDTALQQYWLYYNLDPERKGNENTLATIGDLYLELGKNKPGLEIFSEIRRRYPDSEAAALGLLRLAEKGKHDGPLRVEEMFTVFENPGTPLPQVAYRKMREERPADQHSVLAWLKLSLWQLWNKQFTDAMGTAADFIDAYPEHRDVDLARDIIMRSFMADLKNSLTEENYGRILILWNGFPLVRERYGPMDAELRNALARGYLERGEDDKAMELFSDFLKTPKHPRFSEPTFALYFNKYLEAGNWNALLDLGDMVRDWEMDSGVRGQLDYAMALSAENLGLTDKALVLWRPLSANDTIPLYQRAYATYFLSKDAERRKNIQEAYTYTKASLELFNRLQQERSDKADPERIKEAVGTLMDITEVANRIPEALEWVEAYNSFVPDGSPEYPSLRFREARLYRKLGNASKAKSLLEDIAKNYPQSPFAKAAETELGTFNVSRDLRNFLPGGQGGSQ